MPDLSPRQARWHELFSKFALHVAYTPGPMSPVGDVLSCWAYHASPALGNVSIHGTAQAEGDVRDMMAAEGEETPCGSGVLWRPSLPGSATRRLPGLLGRECFIVFSALCF